MGGDEFVVLLDPAPEQLEAVGLAERMLAGLRREMEVGEATHRVTASIGIRSARSPTPTSISSSAMLMWPSSAPSGPGGMRCSYSMHG